MIFTAKLLFRHYPIPLIGHISKMYIRIHLEHLKMNLVVYLVEKFGNAYEVGRLNLRHNLNF